jgi:uncharacterized membrane protein YbhN (UPF0104 family)
VKRALINLLKIGISVAILTFLVVRARESFPDLAGQEVHWGPLLAASAVLFVMVVTTFVRWYLLVRVLDLPFRLQDAFRLGFLGYMLNFVSLGATGGDLFKAIFIAREQPGRRAEAVATVVIDRMIGLYGLFLVATITVLTTGLLDNPHRQIQIICQATLLATAVSTMGVILVLIPGFTKGRLSTALASLPRVGVTIGKLLGAVRIYRHKLPVVVLSVVMSLGVHSMATVGIYLVARGLPGNAPGFADHFLVVPLALLAGSLPLPLSGLGAIEAVMDVLYVQLAGSVAVAAGTGLMVALAYRAITIVIAIVGFCYYLANRAVVSQIMKESKGNGTVPKAPGEADALLKGPAEESEEEAAVTG